MAKKQKVELVFPLRYQNVVDIEEFYGLDGYLWTWYEVKEGEK